MFRGHSTGVAELVTAAAPAAGMAADEAVAVRRAALVHDVGRVGIPSGWDHPGRLTAEQWERVRLHPYLGERVLGRCTALAQLAELAGRHHERADGSGYHRGLGAAHLGAGARLLAAADAYHAMTEDRPHRRALSAADAAAQLRAEARGRAPRPRLDRRRPRRGRTPRRPAPDDASRGTHRSGGGSAAAARPRANKQVATDLGIANKTVGRHVEHIYAKAGATTRAGATLFSMQHGLTT